MKERRKNIMKKIGRIQVFELKKMRKNCKKYIMEIKVDQN